MSLFAVSITSVKFQYELLWWTIVGVNWFNVVSHVFLDRYCSFCTTRSFFSILENKLIGYAGGYTLIAVVPLIGYADGYTLIAVVLLIGYADGYTLIAIVLLISLIMQGPSVPHNLYSPLSISVERS